MSVTIFDSTGDNNSFITYFTDFREVQEFYKMLSEYKAFLKNCSTTTQSYIKAVDEFVEMCMTGRITESSKYTLSSFGDLSCYKYCLTLTPQEYIDFISIKEAMLNDVLGALQQPEQPVPNTRPQPPMFNTPESHEPRNLFGHGISNSIRVN